MKKALITGITGQDGSYLAEFLLNKGYEVHGVVRRSTMETLTKMSNLKNVLDKIHLHTCSLDNHLAVYKLISLVLPDECYHLAASSFVSYSFEDELNTIFLNIISTHYILSSIKELVPECRIYFAGSSEMFGNADHSPQNEQTRFNPRSIYGISKLSSYHIVKTYRDNHRLYACTGFTYNHESPRRNHAFVTRKITLGVAKIALGLETKIELGNIDAVRDWGYALEYIAAMWLMLNNPHGPTDYVIATGVPHTVRDLLEAAFGVVNLDYQDYVVVSNEFFRPAEQIPLIGDSLKIYQDLKWRPACSFKDMIKEMVVNDIKLLKTF